MMGELEVELRDVEEEEVVTLMVGRDGRSLKGGWKAGVVDVSDILVLMRARALGKAFR